MKAKEKNLTYFHYILFTIDQFLICLCGIMHRERERDSNKLGPSMHGSAGRGMSSTVFSICFSRWAHWSHSILMSMDVKPQKYVPWSRQAQTEANSHAKHPGLLCNQMYQQQASLIGLPGLVYLLPSLIRFVWKEGQVPWECLCIRNHYFVIVWKLRHTKPLIAVSLAKLINQHHKWSFSAVSAYYLMQVDFFTT